MRRPQWITLLGSALLAYALLAQRAAFDRDAAAAAGRPPAAWAAALSSAKDLRQAALKLPADSAHGLDARRAALRRTPASPYLWADYADALVASDRVPEARSAYRRAVQLGPLIAPTLFRAACFHLAHGDRHRGLELSKLLLANLRDYDARLFALFELHGVEPEELLSRDPPLEQAAARAYVAHLLEAQNLPGLSALRPRLIELARADPLLLRDYAALLLDYRRPFEARRAVVDYLEAAGVPDDDDNLAFNGSFERASQPSPLEWRHGRHPCVAQHVDATVAYDGAASLRLDFDCPAQEPFQHLVQRVVLPPGPARLSLQVKLDHLATEQGIGVWLVDPGPRRRLSVETAVLSGTRDWTPLEASFVVPDDAADFELRVFRRPSLDHGGRLRAAVWIDAVTLRSSRPSR